MNYKYYILRIILLAQLGYRAELQIFMFVHFSCILTSDTTIQHRISIRTPEELKLKMGPICSSIRLC